MSRAPKNAKFELISLFADYQPMVAKKETGENFGNFKSAWIIENGNRWECDGRIRYYFNDIAAAFDLVGIKYRKYKSGNFQKVEGYSNNRAFHMSLNFKGTYFDAVAGRFVSGCAEITDQIEAALAN